MPRYKTDADFYPWNYLDNHYDPRYGTSYKIVYGNHKHGRHFYRPMRFGRWVRLNAW